MSIRINGAVVTGIAASVEPCGTCGCPRFLHHNGRGACSRSTHDRTPSKSLLSMVPAVVGPEREAPPRWEGRRDHARRHQEIFATPMRPLRPEKGERLSRRRAGRMRHVLRDHMRRVRVRVQNRRARCLTASTPRWEVGSEYEGARRVPVPQVRRHARQRLGRWCVSLSLPQMRLSRSRASSGRGYRPRDPGGDRWQQRVESCARHS